MKALILAAGLGSRLAEKTNSMPKALVQVAGHPILFYQLKAVLENGIREIGIVVGHCGEKIISYVNEIFPKAKVTFIWNHDYRETNSSYSFWLARDWISDAPYIHLNCDVIFSPSLLKKLIDFPSANVLAVRTDVALGGRLEHVVLEGNRITEMSITRTPHSTGKAFGLAKFDSKGTCFLLGRLKNYLESGDRNQNCFGLIREAVRSLDYRAVLVDGDLLLEVNTLEDLKHAEAVLC